ncbi:MAG: DUF1285 domain-containing protein [Gammaproteobacteria bacterium]|nr:DUF1285 domain-containing protein [Gammaproteobacteria bacterium]MDH3468492.1 DUF1285 domain-containing protein [Gammaproteobacteria bacterium]
MNVETPPLSNLIAGVAATPSNNSSTRDPAFCGDLDMRITRDGVWHYQGSPIRRLPLVKLFANVLRREDDGQYYLVTPREKMRIQVELLAFQAVELRARGAGRSQVLEFRTNADEVITVDTGHRIVVGTDPERDRPLPMVTMRDGLSALLTRPVYYQLVDLAVGTTDNDADVGVWSSGVWFSLAEDASDELRRPTASRS